MTTDTVAKIGSVNKRPRTVGAAGGMTHQEVPPVSTPHVTDHVLGLFHGRFEFRQAGHDTPCWIWTQTLDRDGYARFAAGEKRGFSRAHRFAYEMFVGPVPEGLHLDHLCRNRNCVNPAHLEAVTVRENLMRGDTYAARAVAKTHCKHGHPLSGDNLYRAPNGTRKCRACQNRLKREYDARLKAAS